MKEYDKDQYEHTLEAAALKYDSKEDRAPQIIALGKGYLAGRMVDAARENNVQVVKDKKLSAVLHKLSIGDDIPEQLFKAIAEILVFVSSMDKERKEKFGI